jgi:hypothetical protein
MVGQYYIMPVNEVSDQFYKKYLKYGRKEKQKKYTSTDLRTKIITYFIWQL